MAGTRTGGLKAAKLNKQLYGDNFYRNIGSKGGLVKTDLKKGFATMTKEQHLAASAKGGKISKRG